MTGGEAVLLTPLLMSWGPALIHFCPWALARNHTGKAIGRPLMGQTLFFLTGACRVGKNVQLAGSDLSANFSLSWHELRNGKTLEFVIQLTSLSTQGNKSKKKVFLRTKGSRLKMDTSEILEAYSQVQFISKWSSRTTWIKSTWNTGDCMSHLMLSARCQTRGFNCELWLQV